MIFAMDNFNRADNASSLGVTSTGGYAYTVSATYGISSNQAYCPGGNSDSIATISTGLADARVSVTMANYGSSPYEVCLYFRCLDANNNFRMVRSNGSLLFQKVVAGSRTTLYSSTPTMANGDVYTIQGVGNTIKLYLNGSLLTTITDSFNNTQTLHGFGLATGRADPRWDTLTIEDGTPVVVTSAVTNLAIRSATLNGNITDAGFVAPTIRGIQLNTTPAVDRDMQEIGSFSAGIWSADVTNLTPGTVYWYRAYAENTYGRTYSAWTTFTTPPATYNITIDGIDRTSDVRNETVNVEDILNDQQNTCNFNMIDRSGNGFPDGGDMITITLDDGSILFSGSVVTVSLGGKMENGVVVAQVTCIDHSWTLDRNLVHKTYENMTDKAIIEDIVATYCSGLGITTTNVISTVTINQISFNYIQPTQALRKICDLTGNNWYIDYSKALHYFALTQNPAPFNIDASNAQYFDLKINKDSSQIKNRIYVRGGTYLSDPFTYNTKGDGQTRVFVLPDKPHNVSVTIAGVSKTVGIKNVNTSGYDVYLNFQEKYIELDPLVSTPSSSDVVAVTYTYDIPILIAQENTASILAHGVKEFAIFDKSISTTTSARDRAQAELSDYASNLVEGSFSTYASGFFSGQYTNVSLTAFGISADYIVTSVRSRSIGGGKYVYDVSIASAKTMGIIRFLIEMLEANKNLIELDNNEVVDELFSLTDSLLSDSLTDALTIDSTGAYFTWCPDSLTSSPITRARWDLFQWG